MTKRQNTQLDTFLSLSWYEVALRFLFTFVAKTSEVLLAAGLVISTANFLTDGSILMAHPGVSIAWAWAQALAIDSSLGVSLSYAFECLKQEAWIKGALYGLLTLLLALVAGAITTIDIVSHALHLSTSDAMVQMGINIAVLSILRAIAVIGFILMSRLRDLPLTALLTKTEPEPQPSLASISEQPQEPRVQAMIQALCSQFSAEEMAQILNTCIAAKKLVFAQISPKKVPEPHPSRMDQQRQSHQLEDASESNGTRAAQAEPEQSAGPHLQPVSEPASPMELPEKASVTAEPQGSVEHHHQRAPEPFSQMRRAPEPSTGAPSKEQEIAPEPQDGVVAPSESEAAPLQKRLEQAYQSLLVEGKKPSGRALAERVHVHRSTCVEWLRTRQYQVTENEPILEEPDRGEISVADESPSAGVKGLPGKAPERDNAYGPTEPPDTAVVELPEMDMDLHVASGDVSPDISPEYS